MKRPILILLLVTMVASDPIPGVGSFFRGMRPPFQNFRPALQNFRPALQNGMAGFRSGAGAFFGGAGRLARTYGPGTLDALGTSVNIGHSIFDIVDRTRMWNMMQQYRNQSTALWPVSPQNAYGIMSMPGGTPPVNGTQMPYPLYYPDPYYPYYQPFYPPFYSPYSAPYPGFPGGIYPMPTMSLNPYMPNDDSSLGSDIASLAVDALNSKVKPEVDKF